MSVRVSTRWMVAVGAAAIVFLSIPAGVHGQGTSPVSENAEAKDGKHPMAPVHAWATQATANLEDNIQDYSATLMKRERLGGKLSDAYQAIFVKIRHKPFSVYMCFLAPDSHKGNEVIYIEGKNDG
jgi:hypothetical protein